MWIVFINMGYLQYLAVRNGDNEKPMKHKKVLIIIGHPMRKSFCGALAEAYVEGAKTAGADIKQLWVGELKFDQILWHGYKELQELEEDLKMAQEFILWAEHLVFVYPTWWGTMPALLKGFIDRTFLPGFAFKYRQNSLFWDRLLTNRSARLLVTMDAPPWYYRWVYKQPGHNMMKKTILGFCGVKPVKISEFGPIKMSTEEQRHKWLLKARELGEKIE